jgi:exodeoxyribonuclease V beta subunit
MSAPAIWLAPLAFPLRGNSLIEASAGTGKTFTIAALYLRLVLDHGGAASFGRALMPPDILVVTFTEAATKELRDRIRGRLAEAARAFQQAEAKVAGLLHELRESYPREQWSACARALQAAAEWMDEAAVSTIHAWCSRMLREHAFDSGSLFEQTLLTDLEELIDESSRDYWRSYFYFLDAEEAECVRAWWPHVDTFTRQLRALLADAQRLPDGAEPRQALLAARVESARQLQVLKAPWKQWAGEVRQQLVQACERKSIDGRHRRHVLKWADQLCDWAEGDQRWPLEASSKGWQRLTRAGLAEVWTWGEPLEHPALLAMEMLKAALDDLPDGRDTILSHATRWVAQRINRAQRRQAQMGFDDLLVQLHDALHRPVTGERLAQTIRQQFPVALVDEFQDTDPVQYAIFRRIYGASAGDSDSALVLIGDPKQAIYAFRGADIYTYLAARRDTEGRHFTLGVNYRSREPMVRAVNQLFAQAEQRGGVGAFRFRTEAADPLPFVEVQAQGGAEVFRVQGEQAPALTCWWSAQEDYRGAMAEACAAEIVRLLRLAQQGQAGFKDGDGEMRTLHPRDIAVLVNSGQEAAAVRAALSRGGVRSVYLSDRDNVFDTPAAGELQRLLSACAAPEDGALVRAALGTPLLARPWTELEALGEDELMWESRIEQFRAYLQLWRRQGVLPMVRRLLNDFEVPARLLADGDERQLTDLLHLAELLQQASSLLQGEHALVRYLAEERGAGSLPGENRQVRLESDADLLKVVTIHKSKGLQYPLVFLPFPCACWPVKPNSVPLRYHDEEGRLRVSLRPREDEVRQADEERLGEDLRKLYVALTRAVHATWIGVAPTPEFARTALGWLLDVPILTADTLAQALRASGAAIVAAPQVSGERYQHEGDVAEALAAPLVPKAARERWWIASYSRLLGGLESAQRTPDSAEEANYEEGAIDVAGDAGGSIEGSLQEALHAFPRGAAAGTFLHALLEWAGQQGFARLADAHAEIEAGIARRCVTPQWQSHRQSLQEWLARWLVTPLRLEGAAAVAPAQLHAYQVELEFWFSARAVNVRALDQIVTRYTLAGAARPAMGATQLNGMLKGFIDLVFEHDGRFYVADYKSNRIGEANAHYTARAMHDEVLAHRYDLQYSLYLLALHRLLRARLPDYDYERHMGGAVYLFLRGHAAPTQGLHMERPPKALMDALDALFQGEEGA